LIVTTSSDITHGPTSSEIGDLTWQERCERFHQSINAICI